MLKAVQLAGSGVELDHDPNLVSILDGGLKKWKLENRMLTKEKRVLKEANYKATVKNNLVVNLNQIEIK